MHPSRDASGSASPAGVILYCEHMANTLAGPPADAVLSRLFAAAARDDEVASALPQGRALPSDGAMSPRERSDASQDIYMPVSAEGGRLLYAMVRAARPETVVEFGTSFGISTIFLAAAVTDNGTGRVVTTELSSRKAAAARSNLEQAGVSAVVTLLEGDALQTLADVPGPVGLVLLDGWKDLYLPVLHLLEPRLAPGALVVADDSSFAAVADYLAYVRDPAHGYVTVEFPVEDGMEISAWAGQ
jgi:predicted O-methyltransferase YrrM